MKKFVLFMLSICVILSCGSVYADELYAEEELVYMPIWMQPNTVITYDGELNCTIVCGGYLKPEDIEGREDIAAVGLESHSLENLACPNTKVEYDLHGFQQNVYYLIPGTNDEYQLSNQMPAWVNSDVSEPEAIYTYPEAYYNYDTQSYQHCQLTKSADGAVITGTGRITYYTEACGDAETHVLRAYDCATKMELDDVPGGTVVEARNTYANKTEYYSKYDVGSMRTSILDIWSDSTVNPITDITNNGTIDDVYSGYIFHRPCVILSDLE